MATGDRKVNITVNRLLSKTDMRERWLDFISAKLDEVIAGFFQGQSGIMDQDPILLVADGANKFKLDISDADRVATATGAVIHVPDEADVSKAVKFENANGVTYYVGIKYASVEWNEVQLNPRYGNPEYPTLLESLGEHGAPTSVANTPGVKITLNINSITEAGVDHSGRNVKVWLTVPVSGVQSVAFYEGVSYYAGGNNLLDIPYSGANGPLGQDTGSNPPSTTSGDYRVFIKGVTVKRNTDLRTDGTYAFIGTVTGGGAGNPPASTSIADQRIVFLFTLDKAYDGAGAGLGRKIAVDAGAVELRTISGTGGDNARAQLRLDRIGSSGSMLFMLQAITGGDTCIPLAILDPVVDNPMDTLRAGETVTLSGSAVTFTRVGVDLQWGDNRLSNKMHIAWLHDLDNPADEGLYPIQAIASANSMGLYDLDGNFPSFVATSGKCTLLKPRLIIANSYTYPIGPMLSWWDGALLTLSDGSSTPASLRIMPEARNGKIIIYDASILDVVYYEPRELIVIDPSGVGQANKYPIKLRRSVLVYGGNTGVVPEETTYDRDGVRIAKFSGTVLSRDPCHPLAVDWGLPEEVPTQHTWVMAGIDQHGGILRGHHHRDDFMYHPSRWSSGANAPPCYLVGGTGNGDIVAKDGGAGQKYGHGCIEFSSGNLAVGNYQCLYGPACVNLDSDKDFRWIFRARICLDESTLTDDCRVQIGLGGGPNFIMFERDGSAYWHLKANGVDTNLVVNQPQGKYQWLSLVIMPTFVTWYVSTKDYSSGNYGSGTVMIPSLAGVTDVLYPFSTIMTQTGVQSKMRQDYWEWWEREAIYGRFGTSYNQNHP